MESSSVNTPNPFFPPFHPKRGKPKLRKGAPIGPKPSLRTLLMVNLFALPRYCNLLNHLDRVLRLRQAALLVRTLF